MPHPLDHLLWAVPDLDAGVAHFFGLTGVLAGQGGSHPGFGTRNALAALGGDAYLEIIAPDPAQERAGTRGEMLAALPAPRLIAFAVRSSDIDRAGELVVAAGLSTVGPIAMSRLHPAGHLLAWRVLRIDEGPFGAFLPFFIDWSDTPHPALSTTEGCRLKRFEVAHPQHVALAEIYRDLELDIDPQPAAEPELRALLDTPQGEVVLSG